MGDTSLRGGLGGEVERESGAEAVSDEHRRLAESLKGGGNEQRQLVHTRPIVLQNIILKKNSLCT